MALQGMYGAGVMTIWFLITDLFRRV